jgi:hypothetical protein
MWRRPGMPRVNQTNLEFWIETRRSLNRTTDRPPQENDPADEQSVIAGYSTQDRVRITPRCPRVARASVLSACALRASTFCPICAASRKALRLGCYRASCPCPDRQCHLCRLRLRYRCRSDWPASSCPSWATFRGWQSLPPGHQWWSLDRLAPRFGHMRRYTRAPAPLQLRLS